MGNFDGRPNNAFVGRTAAGPLLFQIIDSLRSNWPEPNQPHLPPPGANLKTVEFCAVSGELPEPWCTQRVTGWFIPGVSPIRSLRDSSPGPGGQRDRSSRGQRRRQPCVAQRSFRILAERSFGVVREGGSAASIAAAISARSRCARARPIREVAAHRWTCPKASEHARSLS